MRYRIRITVVSWPEDRLVKAIVDAMKALEIARIVEIGGSLYGDWITIVDVNPLPFHHTVRSYMENVCRLQQSQRCSTFIEVQYA